MIDVIYSTDLGDTNKGIEFPILMASVKYSGGIVLFAGHNTGTVVSGFFEHKVGHYATNWISAYRADEWRALRPTEYLTLRNQ